MQEFAWNSYGTNTFLYLPIAVVLDMPFSNSPKMWWRAYKKFSAVEAWEISKKAAVEAELKKIEVLRCNSHLTFQSFQLSPFLLIKGFVAHELFGFQWSASARDLIFRSYIQEKLEKKKAEYRERMKNKVADLHRVAEEKRATVEAKRGEDFLKIEETAAKFRATGYVPRKLLGCFCSWWQVCPAETYDPDEEQGKDDLAPSSYRQTL